VTARSSLAMAPSEEKKAKSSSGKDKKEKPEKV
jgi:hypothetical protein